MKKSWIISIVAAFLFVTIGNTISVRAEEPDPFELDATTGTFKQSFYITDMRLAGLSPNAKVFGTSPITWQTINQRENRIIQSNDIFEQKAFTEAVAQIKTLKDQGKRIVLSLISPNLLGSGGGESGDDNPRWDIDRNLTDEKVADHMVVTIKKLLSQEGAEDEEITDALIIDPF